MIVHLPDNLLLGHSANNSNPASSNACGIFRHKSQANGRDRNLKSET